MPYPDRPTIVLVCFGWLAMGLSAARSAHDTDPAVPVPPGAQAAAEERPATARGMAEAEMAAARAIGAADDGMPIERARARLRHLEEAVRLDPTWEEPAFERIVGLRPIVFGRNLDACRRLLEAAEDYFLRFPDVDKDLGRIYDSIERTVSVALGSLAANDPPEWLSEQLAGMLETAQRLTDHAFVHKPTRLGEYYSESIPTIIYRGMQLREVPLDRREAWLDASLQRLAGRIEAARKAGTYDDLQGVTEDLQLLQIRAASLADRDGQPERAVALLADLQARVDDGEQLQDAAPRRMREVWTSLDDAEALDALERWLEHATSMVWPLSISWPTVEVRPERRMEGSNIYVLTPSVHTVSIGYGAVPGLPTHVRPIRPLAEGEGRLYIALGTGDRQRIGYLLLDELGRPVGESHYLRSTGINVWDSLHFLPPPPAAPRVQDAYYRNGKLYLAAGASGILVFDPKPETWTHHAIGDPLPGKAVDTIFPLSEHRLFCIDSEFRNPLCYVFDLRETRVIHQQRLVEPGHHRAPVCIWQHDDELLGFTNAELIEGLPGKNLSFTPFPSRGPYGWPRYPHRSIFDMVEFGERRFFTDADGLHEFDAVGRIVQSWYAGRPARPGDDADSWRNPEIHFPPDSLAIAYRARAAATGGMVYLIDDRGVLAFDPASDTWYGLLRIESTMWAPPVATRGALWVGTSRGLLYLDLADFHRQARETGRVMTTDEFRRRRDAIIQSRPPLERAKFAFAMRRLDEAGELLDTLLAADPSQAEALLLSAYRYEPWCLDQPDEAIHFYRRLAEVDGDAEASLAGLLGWLDVLVRRRQWPAADDLCTRILAEHPRLGRYIERRLWYRQSYIREQMEEKPEP